MRLAARCVTAACLVTSLCGSMGAQQAATGFDLRGTVTGQFAGSTLLTDSPRFGAPVNAGIRTVLYPVFKLNEHWSATGTVQANTRPYFFESFTTTGYGLNGNLLQGSLNYTRLSSKGSLMFRAGQLSTTFGSFLLRYDDAENPLVDLPLQYGYYYKPVSTRGLVAAEADATRGKWDGRVQFSNSSPMNPRGVNAPDQYGNWSGGLGFTPRQGLRLGVSAFRGPYLDRHSRFFRRGEINPNKLVASAVGADAAWTHGHWNLQAEWQRFTEPYTIVPDFLVQAGYVEVKRTLGPRWFIANRSGYTGSSVGGHVVNIESTVAYRPNRLQVIKLGYEYLHRDQSTLASDHTVSIQLVTSLHLLSFAAH